MEALFVLDAQQRRHGKYIMRIHKLTGSLLTLPLKINQSINQNILISSKSTDNS